MNNIAILVTGQPRGLHTIGRVWAEYIRRMIAYTENTNIKVFISTSNREQVIFEGDYKKYNRDYYYNDWELKDYLYYDKISITKPDVLDKIVEDYFVELPSTLGNIGIGSSYYQFWHLQNAYKLAKEFEKENGIEFDLFFKMRLDTMPLNIIYEPEDWKDDLIYLNEVIDQAKEKNINKYVIGAYSPFLNKMAETEWSNFDKDYDTFEKFWIFDDIDNSVYMADIYFMLSKDSMDCLIENLHKYLQVSTEITYLTKQINYVYNAIFENSNHNNVEWHEKIDVKKNFIKSIDKDFYNFSRTAYEKYKLNYLENAGEYFIQKKSDENFVGNKQEYFDEQLKYDEGILGIIHPWDFIELTTSIMMKCCADKIVRWPGKNFVIFRNGTKEQVEEFLENCEVNNLSNASDKMFQEVCIHLKELHKKASLTYNKGYQWNSRKVKK